MSEPCVADILCRGQRGGEPAEATNAPLCEACIVPPAGSADTETRWTPTHHDPNYSSGFGFAPVKAGVLE